jgi:hypothetical protein
VHSRLAPIIPATVLYVLVAAGTILPLYGMTLGYGFDYDDYHFVRPYSPAEVAAAFSGPWDPAGIEVRFFRPLTIVLYAVRFTFFGLNSEAYHALSLLMFLLAAVLFGLLARAFLGSTAAGALAVLAFAVHPAMPYAAVAWITNQMHLLQLLVVLSALLWWFRIRRRAAVWWLPLVAFELCALMVKEDGIMLIPVVVVLHELRRATAERDLPHPPWRFMIVAAIAAAGFLLYRSHALHGIGGYGVPSVEQAWAHYTAGFLNVFRLLPARRPWQPEASWFVTIVPVAALATSRWLPGPNRFTLLAAIAVGASFNLPFVFVVKAQQMYLVATGAALLITAAIASLLRASRWPTVSIGLVVVSCAGLASLAAVSRNVTRDFEPFGKIMLATDVLVTGWVAVPVELRRYLEEKKAPEAASRLSANPATALDIVSFGLHGEETAPDGRHIRWMSGPRTDVYVNAGAAMIELPLRHEIGAFGEPATAVIEVDGRVLDRITFSNGDWRVSSLRLRPAEVPRLRGMHLVVVRLDHAWVPARVIRGSHDARTLGLQVGEIVIRRASMAPTAAGT